jgi:hypothetical protein
MVAFSDRGIGNGEGNVCEKQPHVKQDLKDLHDLRKVVVAGVCCNLDAVSRENLTVLED